MVDFAEPGAPHTERTITLHSLLDVDAYRPSGLVTPPPPRRRRWRRRPPKPIVKEASWIVPVSDKPERRIAVIANQWRLVDASKLPVDEQRAWAVVAARAVTPADAQQLAERIAALQPEARELFLFTCAAENKHRRLRLAALGDLSSQRPSQTTFAMACRLVEAAPTWQQDRGQGARVLLLAMGDGKIEAPIDRIASWTWQLARQPATTSIATPDPTSRTAAACWAPWHRPPARRLIRGRRQARPHRDAQGRWRPAPPSWPSPRRGETRLRSGSSRRRGWRCPPTRSGSPPRSAPTFRHPSRRPSRPSGRGRRRRARRGTRSRSTALWSARRRRPCRSSARTARWSSTFRRPSRCGCAMTPTRWFAPRSRATTRSSGGWRGPTSVLETAQEVRAAAAEQAGLEVSVSKIVGDSALADRRAPGRRRGRRPGRAAHQGGGVGAAGRRRPPGALAAQDGRRPRPRPGGVPDRDRWRRDPAIHGPARCGSWPAASRLAPLPSGASGGAGRAPAAAGSPLRRPPDGEQGTATEAVATPAVDAARPSPPDATGANPKTGRYFGTLWPWIRQWSMNVRVVSRWCMTCVVQMFDSGEHDGYRHSEMVLAGEGVWVHQLRTMVAVTCLSTSRTSPALASATSTRGRRWSTSHRRVARAWRRPT